MNKSHQLHKLEMSLKRLVTILNLDPRCQWRHHFDSCLAQTQTLVRTGASQSELNSLSSSVIHVFGGMGSFTDYAPIKYNEESASFTLIAGAEDFANAADQVHEHALALRAWQ